MFRNIVCLVVFLSIGNSLFSSDPPKIRFDVPQLINCRDVTTEEFANTHSLEKLLEVRLRVSALLEQGSDQQIQELFFFLYSPERSFRVVDYSPKTLVATEFAGPIETSRNRENANNAGLDFSPNLELAGTAKISAKLSDKNGETVRSSKLPPKKLVLASGTQHRESAVYFKYKPTTQATLEGSHELTLVIKVPLTWRADLMHVHCRGFTKSDGSNVRLTSRNDFVMPLYAENATVARLTCDAFLKAEAKLKSVGRSESVKSNKKTKKDLLGKIEKFIRTSTKTNKNDNLLPPNWLGDVIFSKAFSKYNSKVSAPTRSAIANFAKARTAVISLSK